MVEYGEYGVLYRRYIVEKVKYQVGSRPYGVGNHWYAVEDGEYVVDYRQYTTGNHGLCHPPILAVLGAISCEPMFRRPAAYLPRAW
jgi:hypothetical protein